MHRSLPSLRIRASFAHSLAVITLAAAPCAAAESLFTYATGSQDGQRLGASVSIVFDIDADGYSDYAAGSPSYTNTLYGVIGAGRITLYSGKTGAVLRTHTGTLKGGAFGTASAGIGDVNGDQCSEYVVGAPGASLGAGRLTCYDGLTGSVLWTCNGAAGDRLGTSVAHIPSQVKFGAARILVGAPQKAPGTGYALKLDTAGNVLLTLNGWQSGSQFGSRVAYGGDYNGDDVSDLAVSAPLQDGSSPPYYSDCGAVWIFNGSSGLNHAVAYGKATNDHFGKSLTLISDVNGDSHGELLVGAPDGGGSNGFAFAGYARVLSGTNLAVVRTHTPTYHEALGAAVSLAGDWNGDGQSDYAIGSSVGGIYQTGSVTIFSAATGAVITVLDPGVSAWSAGLPSSVAPAGFGSSLAKGNFGTGASKLGLLVGAPHSGYASGSYNQRGAAFVLLH